MPDLATVQELANHTGHDIDVARGSLILARVSDLARLVASKAGGTITEPPRDAIKGVVLDAAQRSYEGRYASETVGSYSYTRPSGDEGLYFTVAEEATIVSASTGAGHVATIHSVPLLTPWDTAHPYVLPTP